MATASLIPVSEYLRTAYEPDCEYIEGKLQERNVGELSHGVLQALLAAIFNNNRRAWGVFAGTETRVQVNAERFRIPDVCVLRSSDPFVPVIHKAPLICIEVLSPDDTIHRMQERIDDFARMGVDHIWLIDPVGRLAWNAIPDGSHIRAAEGFAVPGTPIRIELADLFAELGDMQARG